MPLIPVLQIIHVTDLHFKHVTAQGSAKIHQKRRLGTRFLQNLIEKRNLFHWNEGTQGHYSHAPESFRLFLDEWRRKNPGWYAQSDEDDEAETWLIDTGDLTAFGDPESLQQGRDELETWVTHSHARQFRSIFGNHDAWPEIHPAMAFLGRLKDEVVKQQARIFNKPGWSREDWINKPCMVKIPGTDARIELYAIDTVCFGAFVNTFAVGRMDEDKMSAMRARLGELWQSEKQRHFRILLTHHPLAFPFGNKLPFVVSMGLQGADRCIKELRNVRDEPRNLGSLVHLFLSGHTHIAYPAGELCDSASEIYEGLLGPNQLQLVGGSLMLNKDLPSASGESLASTTSAKVKGYSIRAQDPRNCQAQILQIYSDTNLPGQLVMYRIPVWSEDGSKYDPEAPSRGVRFTFDS
jgi:hypothetical protein